jgi:uncharacterized protein YndB with AHSA1/START domain
MSNPEFVYTTYIKTTPEKLWAAITTPEFQRQYWGVEIRSDWKKGAKWESANIADIGRVTVSGEILEAEPPKRLVFSWSILADADSPHSRVTFDIDAVGDLVRLNVVHDKLKAGSFTAGRIVLGWPRVLSSLKSLLETGKALDIWAGQETGCAATPAKGQAA